MGRGFYEQRNPTQLFVTGFSEIEKPTKNRFVKLMETLRRPPETTYLEGKV
jgi:hypothetical protein